MAEILVRHINGEELTAEEEIRLQARCYRDMRHWENIHYQMSEDLVSREHWHGFRKNLQVLFGIRAYREYWEHESELYSESFRREVEAVIDDPEGIAYRAIVVERFKKSSERATASGRLEK